MLFIERRGGPFCSGVVRFVGVVCILERPGDVYDGEVEVLNVVHGASANDVSFYGEVIFTEGVMRLSTRMHTNYAHIYYACAWGSEQREGPVGLWRMLLTQERWVWDSDSGRFGRVCRRFDGRARE